MTHPDPQAIRAMTAAVRALAGREPLRLSFHESRIYRNRSCTVACLAGHFWLALYGDDVHFDHGVACHAGSGQPVEFLESGNLLTHRLGMSSIDALESWASQNPDLWGRRRGAALLRGPEAYPKSAEGAAGDLLDRALDHWDAVADRTQAHLEEEAQAVPAA